MSSYSGTIYNHAIYPAKAFFPGGLLCAFIALAASFAAHYYGGSAFLYALIIGISMHAISDNPKYVAGIDLCSKRLVSIGVALLGVHIAASDFYDLGWYGIAVLIAGVALTILFGCVLSRILKLPPSLGLLSGIGTGICGISATLAFASILPKTSEIEHHTSLTVVGIALLSTVAMVAYPAVVYYLHLNNAEAGLFIGGAVHDLAQTMAAGMIVSPEVGHAAALTKMFRVTLLIPIMLILTIFVQNSYLTSSNERAPNAKNIFPVFLVVFAVLATLNSFHFIPPDISDTCAVLSRTCLLVSIAALGVKTSLQMLCQMGWRPLILIIGESAFIAIYMLAVIFMNHSIPS